MRASFEESLAGDLRYLFMNTEPSTTTEEFLLI